MFKLKLKVSVGDNEKEYNNLEECREKAENDFGCSFDDLDSIEGITVSVKNIGIPLCSPGVSDVEMLQSIINEHHLKEGMIEIIADSYSSIDWYDVKELLEDCYWMIGFESKEEVVKDIYTTNMEDVVDLMPDIIYDSIDWSKVLLEFEKNSIMIPYEDNDAFYIVPQN